MQYYSLYLYRFGSNTERQTVREFMDENSAGADVSLRQIIDETNENKLKIINDIILAERRREYKAECTNDIIVKIIEYTTNRYLAIISIAEGLDSLETIRRIFKKIKNNLQPSYLKIGKPERESREFWNRVLKEFSYAGKKNYSDVMHRDVEISFPLELTGKESFEDILKKDPVRAKVYLSAAVARLMCMINNSTGIIFEDIHEAGRLSKLPVRIDDTVGTQRGREELKEFFLKADLNDDVEYEWVAGRTGIDLYNATLFTQSFICENSYSEYFRRMKVDNIFHIPPLNPANVPLFVTFRMHEPQKNIQYCYDPDFFGGISIKGFHQAVCQLVDSYLRDDDVEPDVANLIYKDTDLKIQIRDIKLKILGGITVFDKYSKEELSKLVGNFEIKQALPQQPIIEIGTKVNRIYFVVSGRFELTGEDVDGVLKPVCMLKERDVFGLESLGIDNVSSLNYTSASEVCVYMSVEAKLILDEARTHPEIINALFETQNRMLKKFQKLWVMS